MRAMTRLHIEQGESRWATWSDEGSGYSVHDTVLSAVEEVVEKARLAEGHRVVITSHPEVLELGDFLRDASGAEVCRPFDESSERRSRRTIAAGNLQSLLVATDASVRRRGRSTIAIAALGGSSISVSALAVPHIGVHSAEVAGILLGAQVHTPGAQTSHRRIVCDSQGAVRDVLSLKGMDDREIAMLCERLFGSWAYGALGRKLFDGARRSSRDLEEETMEIQWTKGHDDDARSAEHDLNVVADQTARALSQGRGDVSEVQRAHARSVSGAICGSRFPKLEFHAGAGLR